MSTNPNTAERLDRAVADATGRLEAVRRRTAEVSELLADLAGAGDPDDSAPELRGEAAALAAEASALEATLPTLERRRDDARRAADATALRELIERAAHRAAELTAEARSAGETVDRLALELETARARAATAGALARDVADAARAVRAIAGDDSAMTGGSRTPIGRLLGLAQLGRAGESAARVLDRDGLLSAASRSALEAALAELTPEAEAERREGIRRAQLDAQEAENEAAREAVDGWLRGQLEGGPVAAGTIRDRARAEGIPLARHPHGADVASARGRLAALSLELKGSPRAGAWWALPSSEWDRERFEVYAGPEGARLAEMR